MMHVMVNEGLVNQDYIDAMLRAIQPLNSIIKITHLNAWPIFVVFQHSKSKQSHACMLTHAALDPEAKIAEVKYCAVRISKPG